MCSQRLVSAALQRSRARRAQRSLVSGAEDDICFTQQEVCATSAAYDAAAEIFPKMSHDMTLNPGRLAVAERIHAWLEICVPAN